MNRVDVVSRLIRTGVIAVVRAPSVADAEAMIDPIMAGGIDAIEVTMTVPGALGLLESLDRRYGERILLGAGTVLDPETARQAILAGARYVLSPALNTKTIELCLRYQVAVVPGCQTVTEALTAAQAGADLVKLFPAEVLGPRYLKAVRAALPQILFVPTGGVGPDNAGEWVKAGAAAVGVGGELTRAGSPEAIAAVARRLVEAVRSARN